eukprot:1332220-Prymnesium_polylepis.1
MARPVGSNPCGAFSPSRRIAWKRGRGTAAAPPEGRQFRRDRGGRRGELAIASDVGGHRRAGARLGEHSAVFGRCLELGPLPALNCGRLATWHRERHAVGGGDFG